MHTVTTKISDNINQLLSELAQETKRSKGYIMQRAIESYIQDKADILIALSRIEEGGERISLDEIEQEYDLGN
ncbi:MAG: antitoxin of toxin-antitoxin stability system [Rickettsiaceae bacterium]